MDANSVERVAPRRPWAALVLSAVTAGLGHVYCGRIVKGLVLLVAGLVLGGLAIMMLVPDWFGWGLAAMAASAALWLYAMSDALRLARRSPTDYRLKDYNHWAVYVLLAVLVVPLAFGQALVLRSVAVQAFRVATSSMEPTLSRGDRVLASMVAYRSGAVCRGDVVALIPPDAPGRHYVKRVVALGSDTVAMRGGRLVVNGSELPLTATGRTVAAAECLPQPPGGRPQTDAPEPLSVFRERNGSAAYDVLPGADVRGSNPPDFAEVTVPAGHCFVLGDNRAAARDSRHFGPVALDAILGRVEYRYWPGWRRLAPHTGGE